MSQTLGSKAKQNGDAFHGRQFIPLDFSLKERTVISDWLRDREIDLGDEITQWVDAGWKVSFSWSDHYKTHFVSVTCNDSESPYHKVTYSLKHPDLFRGCQIMFYVRAELLPNSGLPNPALDLKEDW